MKSVDILKFLDGTIEEVSHLFAHCINLITSKMIIHDGYNVIDGVEIIKDEDNEKIDSETYDKFEKTENYLFKAFANLLMAKEILGKELTLPELMIKNQYQQELVESMEMYREFKNAEEILRMKEAWQNIDNGYAEHIRLHFPEINLNQL